jgi:Mrp family chromosome partitioning ATPase
LKDDKGKSFQELGMLHSLDVKDGAIQVKLNLTSDYRKVKTLIQDKLKQTIPWASKVDVTMAPAPQ